MEADFSLMSKPKRKSNKVSNGTKTSELQNAVPVASSNIVYKYTLDDFHKFKQSMKIQIPPAIMNKLKIVYQQMKEDKEKHYKNYIPQSNKQNAYTTQTHTPTQTFTRSDFNNKKRKQKACELNDDDWEAMRNFKITQKDKKEGFDKVIDSIRSLLNKMTDDNFHEFSSTIHETIQSNINDYSLRDFFCIVEIIITIVSNNAFYSNMYADFLVDLFQKYSELRELFDENYKSLFSLVYSTNFEENRIRIGNAEENYDLFCEINKENETRKNMCLFLGDLLNFNCGGVLSLKQFYSDLVESYFALFIQYAEDDAILYNECNEVCEIYSILHNKLHMYLTSPREDGDSNGEDILIVEKQFSCICDTIKYIQSIKKSELRDVYPSINNKILFKLMDVKLNMP